MMIILVNNNRRAFKILLIDKKKEKVTELDSSQIDKEIKTNQMRLDTINKTMGN